MQWHDNGTADHHAACANARGLVSTMELAQLDELDFAAWKTPWAELDDEAPEVDEETRKVLTLRRLIDGGGSSSQDVTGEVEEA